MRKVALLVLVLSVLASAAALAGPKANANIKGWEKGGEYDQLFDLKEADTLKGRVVKVLDLTPFPDMAPGVGLQIEDKKEKGLETVHLGPKDFVNFASSGIREGDSVKVSGVWTEFDGHDVMLAIKVKKDDGGAQLKVRRTKDGFPLWSLSPEERQRELSGD